MAHKTLPEMLEEFSPLLHGGEFPNEETQLVMDESRKTPLYVEDLIEIIQSSKKTYEVCVRSTDYYSRSTDFNITDIELIDPYTLIDMLQDLTT